MQIRGHDIGVCSWSLHPRDTAELVQRTRQLGLEHVQLALGPLLAMNDAAREKELDAVRSSGLTLTAGMIGFVGEDYSTIAAIRRTGGIVPDEQWPGRREFALAALPLCRALGLTRMSLHAGFIPRSSDPGYGTLVTRLGELAEPFAAAGITLLLETGQETASELLQFLNDLRTRNVEVNFDPANMILYGSGDPVEAVHTLGRHIAHVHIKDAVASDMPRVKWGQEVPFGTGQVGPKRFLDALDAIDYTGPLVIEREAGDERMTDVRTAIESLQAAT